MLGHHGAPRTSMPAGDDQGARAAGGRTSEEGGEEMFETIDIGVVESMVPMISGAFAAWLEVSSDVVASCFRVATWIVDTPVVIEQEPEPEEEALQTSKAGTLCVTGLLCQALRFCPPASLLIVCRVKTWYFPYHAHAKILGFGHICSAGFLPPASYCAHLWTLEFSVGVALALSAWHVFSTHYVEGLRDGGRLQMRAAGVLWGVSVAHLLVAAALPDYSSCGALLLRDAALTQGMCNLVGLPLLMNVAGSLTGLSIGQGLEACVAASSAFWVGGVISSGPLSRVCLVFACLAAIFGTHPFQDTMTAAANRISPMNGKRWKSASDSIRAGMSAQYAVYLLATLIPVDPLLATGSLAFLEWLTLHYAAEQIVTSKQAMNMAANRELGGTPRASVTTNNPR
eukprot:TRINITY_DN47362_c0_g1_i1.p1 TRINITY_DN47362_c0_g1~~TRINITY_DN47362_c0_g1_i1.p1  ORF type:complete len:399 (+),score=28.01 TRINITY_DN47362_c0_g1_i1:394-1590(+)